MDSFFKNLNEVLKVLFNAVLFVVFPIVAITLITSKSPMFFGMRSFVVLTGSMEPTIETGSIIYTLPGVNYQDTDIIAFKSGDKTITHRVINLKDQAGKTVSELVSPVAASQPKISSVLYQTQGDANRSADSQLVSKDQVVGKVLFHIPFVGKLINFLKTPLGFLLLIILPTLLFIMGELWNIKKEIEKNLERKLMNKMRLAQESQQSF
jgi:signal peptidase I